MADPIGCPVWLDRRGDSGAERSLVVEGVEVLLLLPIDVVDGGLELVVVVAAAAAPPPPIAAEGVEVSLVPSIGAWSAD